MRRGAVGELEAELHQSRPFRSEAQEATIALLRTASVVSRQLGKAISPSGISLAQYNVLRILRGAGTAGLPTLAIKDRMIEEGTTITRLLDKLEDAGLVHRKRSRPDRRQVLCTLTPAGAKLLAKLDPAMDAADEAAVVMLDSATQRQLIAVLSAVRHGAPKDPN
ncbi:MAG: MarR family winged helix-turn-helix transcriptional regulator [Gemmatimonadaceae bacterium]